MKNITLTFYAFHLKQGLVEWAVSAPLQTTITWAKAQLQTRINSKLNYRGGRRFRLLHNLKYGEYRRI